MSYLKISNSGEVEVKAFTKIGYSSKTNDPTKIGEFGSGLNYAIAWFMRNGIVFKAFSGKRDIIFEIIKSSFRGSDMDVIKIDGEETSFCLTMGGDKWEGWMAIREIYCNALDENDASVEIVDEIVPEYQKTCFFIEINDKIQNVIDNWDNYFSQKRKDILLEGSGFKLLRGGDKLIVYRKGIRCFTYDAPSMFHYDLDDIKINESRIVEDTWELDRKLVSILAGKLTSELIQEFVSNVSEYKTYESKLHWDWYGSYYYSDTWKEVFKGKKVTEQKFFKEEKDNIPKHHIVVPSGMARALVDKGIQHAGGRMANEIEGTFEIELESKDKEHINKALKYLQSLGYNIAVSIRKFRYSGESDKKIKSYYIKRTIYLNEELFGFTTYQSLANYIIMENERMKSGYTKKQHNEFELYLIERILKYEKSLKESNIKNIVSTGAPKF